MLYNEHKTFNRNANLHLPAFAKIYNTCLFNIFFISGDVREALQKVKQYVTSESAFFNAFLEEGLRFSSSMYLCLIWIRVLKHVFENPSEAFEISSLLQKIRQ